MTYIIAEAGVNHEGSMQTALELVREAKNAGADAVKFQLFSSDKLWGDNRIAHLELTQAHMRVLQKEAQGLGLDFLCTPFDRESLAFLAMLGVPKIKVASGMLRRHGFLSAVRETELPVILSTGMATMEEISDALIILGHHWPALNSPVITIMHCTSAYPCPLDQVNLAALDIYRHKFGHSRCHIGYSDHTATITASVAAVAKGAEVIEKHLTLDRGAPGPDHAASIEPKDFRRMVDMIREVEQCLIYSPKKVMPSEVKLREVWK